MSLDATDNLTRDDTLALAYEPRRVRAALLGTAWNLTFAAGFIAFGAAEAFQRRLAPDAPAPARVALFAAMYFLCHAFWCYPLELWFGYLQERQFALAKDGIRAWSADVVRGLSQQGLTFITGSTVLVCCQIAWPGRWFGPAASGIALLMLGGAALGVRLLPRGLFSIEPPADGTWQRLTALVPELRRARLPVRIVSAPSLREFTGGLLGLGPFQTLLISRSTILSASDTLLRFVLLHELGHRRHRHIAIGTVTAIAVSVAGLGIADRLIPPIHRGAPQYTAYLALTFSLWMALTEPLLAFVGRRLEYQADRHALRHGISPAAMRQALHELAAHNLAPASTRRRRSFVHPMPSVRERLNRARRFELEN